MKIAVFGDVHGHIQPLEALHAALRGKVDRFFSVGDLIDRGPASREVVEFCIAEDIEAVTGNHELWLRASILAGHPVEMVTGWGATVASYDGQMPGPVHADWLLSLPYFRRIGRVLISHAGVQTPRSSPEDAILAMGGECFCWNFLSPVPALMVERVSRVPGMVQVFGHSRVQNVVISDGHFVALDTGCGTRADGRLSAAVLDSDTGAVLDIVEAPVGQ